jgi:hypothetical protein
MNGKHLPSVDSSTRESSTALLLLPRSRRSSLDTSSSGDSESRGESLALEDFFFCVGELFSIIESKSKRAEFRLLFVDDKRGSVRDMMDTKRKAA